TRPTQTGQHTTAWTATSDPTSTVGVFNSYASGTPQPLLIVGSYEFNEGATNDDVSRLWVVDPNTASEVATLGAASAPTYTSASGTSFPLVSSGVLFGLSDTDIGIKDSANNPKVSEIRSFFMREGGS